MAQKTQLLLIKNYSNKSLLSETVILKQTDTFNVAKVTRKRGPVTRQLKKQCLHVFSAQVSPFYISIETLTGLTA